MKQFIIVFIVSILFLAIIIGNCSEDSYDYDELESTTIIDNSSNNTLREERRKESTELVIGNVQIEYVRSLLTISEQILTRKAYIVSYNKETKLPNWVAWHLTCNHTDGPFSRSGEPYYTDDGSVWGIECLTPEIVRNGFFVDMEAEEPRQTHEDWRNNKYLMTRGHLCPAADNKWSKEAMNQSFLLTNICPQTQSLNGGAWQKLEEKCRTWAKQYGDIYIVSGPVFTDGIVTRTMGENKVAIPDAFFKVVLCMNGVPRALGFVYKNDDSSQSMITNVCSVDYVEKLTGFDFFYSLPDEIEEEIESYNDFSVMDRKVKGTVKINGSQDIKEINADYLTAEEKEVIRLCNLARNDGKRFWREYCEPNIENKSSSYVKSLKTDLENTHGLCPLKPSKQLYEAAKFHAIDMGKTGGWGHDSSDGLGCHDRIRKFTGKKYGTGENCSYGYNKAIDIVLRLLIDENVESLGHRKNILRPEYNFIGVSIQPHKKYGYNCVMDFAYDI